MSYLTANGRPVERGRITLPRRGVWHAEVVQQGRAFGLGPVSLVLGGALAFRGTVREGGSGGSTKDTTPILLQGGAGTLANDVQPQHFLAVPLRIPLERALGDVGEAVSPDCTESFMAEELPHWVSFQEPAQRVVENLARAVGASWRVLTDGRVWMGEETWPSTPRVGYTILGEWPTSRQVRLSLDAPLILPGYTFEGRKVAQVQHNIAPDRITCDVWFDR